MDFILENEWAMYSLIGVSLLMGTYGLVKLYFSQKRKSKRAAYPKDVVILHQFPISLENIKPEKAALSAYCLKLETWLKVTGTKYENDFSIFDRSPKGKLPYITLNDEDISDSYFAMQWLSDKYGKDLNASLTNIEKAISRAFFKLAEESFKWTISTHKLKYGTAKDMGLPAIIFKMYQSKGKKACNIQGYGTHTQSEVYEIGNADLKAMEDFLGYKKYFFGDNITTVDIEIFAWITQVVFYDRGQFNTYFREQCPNLVRHFVSIKTEYWPEWKEKYIKI